MKGNLILNFPLLAIVKMASPCESKPGFASFGHDFKDCLREKTTDYNLYYLHWEVPDHMWNPGAYSMSATFDMIVNAKSPEEAKAIAPTGNTGMDTRDFWDNPEYICCALIGSSFIDGPKVISANSQHDTG